MGDMPNVTHFDGFDRIFHAYQPGRLVIHTGDSVHQIAPSTYSGPDDVRITLQGHLVRVRGVWQLYW